MQKKIVLFLGGGAMSGVFGAGFVTALGAHGFQKNIEAVYAVSAGAFNGAYFLSEQYELGSSIYYEDLTARFIKGGHLLPAMFQRIWHRYVTPVSVDAMRNPIDIDYLIDVAKHKKVLDIKKLSEQPIPFYIKLLGVESGNIELFDIRKYNPFDILHAAVSAAPYYHSYHKVNGKLYIDAGIKEPIGLEGLITRHPDQKIIIQLNRHYSPSLLGGTLNVVESKFLNVMHGRHIGDAYRLSIKRRDSEIERLKLLPNITFVQPKKEDSLLPLETNKHRLLHAYEAGKKKGLDILKQFS